MAALAVCPLQTLFMCVHAQAEYFPKPSEGEKGLFYSGLVNISGTYCFMNSTMQVRQPRYPMPAISPQRISDS
jgi:hypothetical protein